MEGETELFLCVVPKEKLSDFLERNKSLQIDTEILPVDADVLSNSSHSAYEVILDIGHTRTLCVLCLEGKAIQIRVLSRGISTILNRIRENYPSQDALELITQTALLAPNVFVEEDEEGSTPDTLLVQDIQKWSTAVRQLLISFEDQLEIAFCCRIQ